MSENKTIRIKTTPNGGDKHLKISLTQDFDFIEILSLKLSSEDVYRKFCADYGVIAGRVVVNQGFGVPNAKVSIFIPLSETDKLNPEISGLYPYEIITDKNSDGIRYNLLPKDSDNQDPCFTPIGSFPSKREILDNDIMLDIYCKYYKFTTTTNHAGDFMIFGVPLGNYIVQVDADISDIGLITQKPYDLIGKGTPQKLFESPSKFKSSKNLDSLTQVKTLRSGVTVKPFWGDLENCEIGINRLDFDLQTNITPSAIFVGSIFGDNEKHSVNKHCRPRRDLGKLCDMVSGEGTIEMIRKTFDGNIEQFDVDGGRVIDDNGAWAYQIPMNLDYVITDEAGNLIPSDDQNIGLPTRASVRFRIGMDVTGAEGRLRTRAKYLVPHNPQNFTQSDYTFDDTTKDDSFRDLYWNKIYSVKNFIPRYQTNSLITNKNYIGIKDVDGCVGTHNPFPYNRLLSDFNPVFGILCIIINIIVNIIALINNVIIGPINNFFIAPINNFVINPINSIMNSIVGNFCFLWNKVNGILPASASIGSCPLSWSNINQINYISCIVLKCGDNNDTYSPGCNQGSNPGFQSGTTHYPNDSHNHGIGAGLADCYLIQLADALNIFQFDFYNDWINGSLYSFLLKYKKRKHGQEKFCEYDCSPNFTGGVDGNNNNIPDNDCVQSYLVDSCAYSTNINSISTIIPPNVNFSKSFALNDGLIKKVDDEFYYAAYTHSGNKLLFATDIIHLGSIFDCDWQGIPKIEQYLVPTTYKRPPNTSEYEPEGSGNKVVCGISSIGSNTPNDGLFFDIDCLGIKVSTLRCQNIKKQCEFGVDIDSEDDSSTTFIPANCNIGPEDIEQVGVYFRDVFYNLNNSGINVTTYPYLSTINTSFASSTNTPTAILGPTVGLTEYNKFRNYLPNTNNNYEQPINNSYFFYFGLIPNKSAVDLLKNKYFTTCKIEIEEDFNVIGNVTDVTSIGGNDGSINNIIIVGNSTTPYTYSWSGPAGFISTSQNIFNLIVGTYKLIVTDANGFIGKASFIVNQPQPTFCTVSINKDSYTTISNDGEIIINAVGGGIPPYYYNMIGPVNSSGGPSIFNSFIINNLSIGNYIMDIYDSASIPTHCINSGLTINSATALNVTVNKVDSGCYKSNIGSININIASGVPPYSVLTTCTALGYSSPLLIQGGLTAGTYVVTVQDALSQINTQNVVISEDAQMTIGNITGPQCSSTSTIFYLNIVDPSTTISWLSSPWIITGEVDGTLTSNFIYTPVASTPNLFKVEFTGPEAFSYYRVNFTNSNGCTISDTWSKLSTIRPTVTLGGNITSVSVSPNTVQLTANPSGGNSPYTYLWTDLWTSTIIATTPYIYASLNPSGYPFSCLISDSKGCQITLYYTTP